MQFKQYLSIIIIFFIIFAMTYGLNNSEEILYGEDSLYRNEYLNEQDGLLDFNDEIYGEKDKVLYIGDTQSQYFSVVMDWAFYSKREIKSFQDFSLQNLSVETGVILIEPDYILSSMEILRDLSFRERNFKVILLGLNRDDIVSSFELRELVGINDQRMVKLGIHFDELELAGIWLYSGFLLGGERIYDSEKEDDNDSNGSCRDYLKYPWYLTGSGTEVYMRGILNELDEASYTENLSNEDMPALIWKSHYNNMDLIVLDSKLILNGRIGIGLLESSIYKLQGWDLYPIVNAQLVSFISYPYIVSEEDEQRIKEEYGKSSENIQLEVILTSLNELYSIYHLKPTCYVGLSQAGLSEDLGLNKDYIKYINKVHGELGIFVNLADKMDGLYDLFPDTYTVSSLSFKGTYNDLVEFIQNNGIDLSIMFQVEKDDGWAGHIIDNYNEISVQCVSGDIWNYNFISDLELLGVETLLGYSNYSIDIAQCLLPESENNKWQVVSKSVFNDLVTALANFQGFDRTCISDSAHKVKKYLKNQYLCGADDNIDTIELRTSLVGCSFLLRLQNRHIKTGSYDTYDAKLIEDGVYLIYAKSNHINIKVESDLGLQ